MIGRTTTYNKYLPKEIENELYNAHIKARTPSYGNGYKDIRKRKTKLDTKLIQKIYKLKQSENEKEKSKLVNQLKQSQDKQTQGKETKKRNNEILMVETRGVKEKLYTLEEGSGDEQLAGHSLHLS